MSRKEESVRKEKSGESSEPCVRQMGEHKTRLREYDNSYDLGDELDVNEVLKNGVSAIAALQEDILAVETKLEKILKSIKEVLDQSSRTAFADAANIFVAAEEFQKPWLLERFTCASGNVIKTAIDDRDCLRNGMEKIYKIFFEKALPILQNVADYSLLDDNAKFIVDKSKEESKKEE